MIFLFFSLQIALQLLRKRFKKKSGMSYLVEENVKSGNNITFAS